MSETTIQPPAACEFCGGVFRHWHTYQAPPAGETKFDFHGDRYHRSIFHCADCGHFVSVSANDLSKLYSLDYVDATYGSGFAAAFDRIMSLPPDRSDNFHRANRVDSFVRLRSPAPRRLLDIGAGLGVFPARMKELGWSCTALDPDPRACAHARQRIGVETIQGDFLSTVPTGRFDLLTLNKVLEHVEHPSIMLRHTRDFLSREGIVYVEVPDGPTAAQLGPGREEFFIEHVHVFSDRSLCLLAEQSGFAVLKWEAIIEPSSKCTLFAFLEPIKR